MIGYFCKKESERFEFYRSSFYSAFPSGFFKKTGTELKILPESSYQF